MSLHQLAANALWKFGKHPVWLSIFPSSLQFTLLCEIANKEADVEMQLFFFSLPVGLFWSSVEQGYNCPIRHVIVHAIVFPGFVCFLFFFRGDNVVNILSRPTQEHAQKHGYLTLHLYSTAKQKSCFIIGWPLGIGQTAGYEGEFTPRTDHRRSLLFSLCGFISATRLFRCPRASKCVFVP